MEKVLVTITGPSASGKSFLERALVGKGKHSYRRLISTTSRKIRPDEKDGEHYYFLKKREFEDQKPSMVEWKHLNNNFYGLSRHELTTKLSNGAAVLVVDPKGAKRFRNIAKEHDFKLVSIFLDADEGLVRRRLAQRIASKQMTKEEVEDRIQNESGWAKKMDWAIHLPAFESSNENEVIEIIDLLDEAASKGILK